MRILSIIAVIIVLFSSCDSGPFINHSLDVEKMGNCVDVPIGFKVTSNTNGQRYEFNSCLADEYNKKSYLVGRSGDTILVDLKNQESQHQSLYKVTLDIDASPGYTHIKIGNQVMQVFATAAKY
ncbi:MAG: hypothetical protein HY305_04955 [Sphingobacteriales bacterium]|nr:hypothetical protein [Sphingobacteriales bacterium]